MAKQPEGYDDALKSIFDFIFKQAKKDGKLKPEEIEGASSQDLFAQVLAEMAARPSHYASSQVLDAINGAYFSPALVQFWVDKIDSDWLTGADDSAGRVRVRPSDTGKFIKDPRGFIEKAYDDVKQARTAARIAGLGSAMDAGLAWYHSAKNGMSMEDAMSLGLASNNQFTLQAQDKAQDLLIENAALATMQPNKAAQAAKDLTQAFKSTGELRASRTLGPYYKLGLFTGSRNDYYKTVTSVKGVLTADQAKLLTGTPSSPSQAAAQQKLRASVDREYALARKRYNDLQTEMVSRGYSPSEVSQMTDVLRWDNNLAEFKGGVNHVSYRRLLMENRARKAELLNPVQDRAQLEQIQKEQAMVTNWQKLYATSDPQDFLKAVTSTKSKLQSMVGSVTDPQLQSRIQGSINRLTRAEAEFERRNYSARKGLLNVLGLSTGIDVAGGKKYLAAEIEGNFLHTFATLKDKRSEYQNVLSAGTDPDKARDLRREIRDLGRQLKLLRYEKSSLSSLPGVNFRTTLATYAGAFNYYKDVMQGGVGTFIMTGQAFFDAPYSPGSIVGRTVKMRKVGYGSKDADYEAHFVVPRDMVEHKVGDVPLTLPHLHLLSTVYYLTPGSLVKTLAWNGEGFTYLAYMYQRSIMETLNSNSAARAEIMSILGLTSNKDYQDLLNKDFFKLVDALSQSNNPALRKLQRSITRMDKAREFVGGVGRFLNNNVAGRFMKYADRFRTWTMGGVKKLLKGKIQNKLWQETVDKFVAGAIGLRQLIKEGVKIAIQAVLQALNIGISGGLLTPLVALVSWVVTEVIYKAGKFLLQFAGIALWGVIGILGMLFFLLFFGFGSLNSSYRHVQPASANQCVAFNPHSGLYPEPEFGDIGSDFPPSDSTCPLNFEPKVCTQGPVGDVSTYHQNYKAIDVGTRGMTTDTWTAPSDGEVVSIDPVNYCAGTGANYGGIVRFQDSEGNIYTVMHVKALVGTGPVRKGTPVATSQKDLTPDGSCWTGPHYHLHVYAGGGYANSLDWYENKLNCGALSKQADCHY